MNLTPLRRLSATLALPALLLTAGVPGAQAAAMHHHAMKHHRHHHAMKHHPAMKHGK